MGRTKSFTGPHAARGLDIAELDTILAANRKVSQNKARFCYRALHLIYHWSIWI